MIIGLSGYIGAGKDTVAKMIQYHMLGRTDPDGYRNNSSRDYSGSGWHIKKFAYKLKQMVSLLTGIPVEDLEKQEVKSRELGPEWNWYDYAIHTGSYKSPGTPRDRTGERNRLSLGSYERASLEEKEYHDMQVHAMTVRELLQKLGTDAVRDKVHPNAWVNALMSEYTPRVSGRTVLVDFSNDGPVQEVTTPIYGEYPNWIISDCRFGNEAQAIKDRGGVVWRVDRDIIHQGEVPRSLHSSETSLDNWKFDYQIQNDGSLEELLSKVLEALKEDNLLKT